MIRLESPADLQRTSAVARCYVLSDVHLVSLDAKRRRPHAGVPLETQLDEKSARAERVPEGDSLRVTVAFGVRAGLSAGADFETHVQVEGAFELLYARVIAGSPFNDADLQLFARINGTHNAWPYMREVVANNFARMGYPAFTLESLVVLPRIPNAPPVPETRPTAAGRN
jgi:preprotein translocase subunit SecB